MPTNSYTFAGQTTFSPSLHGFGSILHYKKIVTETDDKAIEEARKLFQMIQIENGFLINFAALYQGDRQVIEFNNKPEKTIISRYGSRLWKGIDI